MEKVLKILKINGFEIPHSMSKEAALLTPEFWQVMAKTYMIKSYKRLAKNFITGIMNGKTIDEYFAKF